MINWEQRIVGLYEKMSDFMPVLHHLAKERRKKAASKLFASPFFTISARYALRVTGRIVGSKLTGRHMSKKDALALVTETAISIGTDLALDAIHKANQSGIRHH